MTAESVTLIEKWLLVISCFVAVVYVCVILAQVISYRLNVAATEELRSGKYGMPMAVVLSKALRTERESKLAPIRTVKSMARYLTVLIVVLTALELAKMALV